MRLGLALALSVLGFSSQMAAAEGLPAALSCSFKEGATSSYEAGSFKSSAPQPLAFTVEGIDLDKQTGRIALPDGKTGKVSVVQALNATHFIEVLVEGFMTVTTIYDLDPETGLHPAVHSRHMGIVGAPLVAQYTGACKGTSP